MADTSLSPTLLIWKTQIIKHLPQVFVRILWDHVKCQACRRCPVNIYFSFFLPFLNAAPSQSKSQKLYSANAQPNTGQSTSFWPAVPCPPPGTLCCSSTDFFDVLWTRQTLFHCRSPRYQCGLLTHHCQICSNVIFSTRPTLAIPLKLPTPPFPSVLCYHLLANYIII